MKIKMLIGFGVMALAAVIVVAADVLQDGVKSKPSDMQLVRGAINISSQSIQPLPPMPNIYITKPYSLRLIVPKSVDSQMMASIDDEPLFKIRCLKPEMRFEK